MADMLTKLHEMYARNNMELLEVNKRLAERSHALEHLIEQGIVLMDTYTYPGTTDADAWVERAKALLQGENRKESE